MSKNNTARKLYDMLVSRGFDPLESDSNNTSVIDPGEGDIVKFDYIAPSGKNYGTVVMLLGDDGDLSMFFGDEKGRTMEPDDRTHWFEFLQDMKPWANWNHRDFRPYNMSQLKHHLTTMRRSLAESVGQALQGNSRASWTDSDRDARLLIQHSQRLGEHDRRFRNIERIFVETSDGERFRLPFRNLRAARAMLEHVRSGGRPWDLRGNRIAEMVTELNVLSRFRRAYRNRLFEQDVQGLVETADQYYAQLRETLTQLGTSQGYQAYFEHWQPLALEAGQETISELRVKFQEQTIDQRIEQALPLLAQLQRRNAMPEVQEFAQWSQNITEGTWKVPDATMEFHELADLMSKPWPVGADALDITEQLNDLFGDDVLFDRLRALAQRDPNADGRDIIEQRARELGIEFPQVIETPDQSEPQTEPTQEMLQFPVVTESGHEQLAEIKSLLSVILTK